MKAARGILAALALAVAGCADTDPARSRLTPGTEAIIAAPPGTVFALTVPETGKPYADGFSYPERGDRVSVDDDSAEPVIAHGLTREGPDPSRIDPDREFDHRPARVTVLDGRCRGEVGTIDRWALRPRRGGLED